jgi:hypothetical protein
MLKNDEHVLNLISHKHDNENSNKQHKTLHTEVPAYGVQERYLLLVRLCLPIPINDSHLVVQTCN